jgi:hypothetical protein
VERRELQSILRVTAYAIGKKGLSIGMVNRKGFAVPVFQKAIDLEPGTPRSLPAS